MSRLAAAINQSLREGLGRERESRARLFSIGMENQRYNMENQRYNQARSDAINAQRNQQAWNEKVFNAEQARWESGYKLKVAEHEAAEEDADFRRDLAERSFNRQVGMDRYNRYHDKRTFEHKKAQDEALLHLKNVERSDRVDQFTATQILEKQKMRMQEAQNRITNAIARDAQESIAAYRRGQLRLGTQGLIQQGNRNMAERAIEVQKMRDTKAYRDAQIKIGQDANAIRMLEAGQGSESPSTTALNRAERIGREVSPVAEEFVEEARTRKPWWQIGGTTAAGGGIGSVIPGVGTIAGITIGGITGLISNIFFSADRGRQWSDPQNSGDDLQTDLWESGRTTYQHYLNETGSPVQARALAQSEWYGILGNEEYGEKFKKQIGRKVPGPNNLTRQETAMRVFMDGVRGENNPMDPETASPQRSTEIETILDRPFLMK